MNFLLACSSVKNSLIFAQSGKKSGHIPQNVKLVRYECVKLFRALYVSIALLYRSRFGTVNQPYTSNINFDGVAKSAFNIIRMVCFCTLESHSLCEIDVGPHLLWP